MLVAAAVLLAGLPVGAHPLNVGLADITVLDAEVEVSLSLNLFELDLLLTLDRNLDGRIDPEEVEVRRGEIAAYLASRVEVIVGAAPLPMEVAAFSIGHSADGKPTFDATLRFPSPIPLGAFRIRCEPLGEFGADHRVIARITRGGRTGQWVFQPGVVYEAGARSASAYVVQFLGLGIHHILIGIDHLAFLVALVITGGGWLAVAKIVTSFTAAHSVTLSLAALDVVTLPSRLVEPAIALSVAYVAMENLLPRPLGRRWVVSGFFGLVHGFGFAAVLREMGLPREGLVASLFLFNVGVEIGQVLFVSLLLPLLWLLRRTPAYPVTVRSASLGLLAIALVWFVQRVQ
jgi:hydrogenase/urease accessory protein HupE